MALDVDVNNWWDLVGAGTPRDIQGRFHELSQFFAVGFVGYHGQRRPAVWLEWQEICEKNLPNSEEHDEEVEWTVRDQNCCLQAGRWAKK